jgi:hypothetical protein
MNEVLIVQDEPDPQSISPTDQRLMLVVILILLGVVILLVPFFMMGIEMKFIETILGFCVFVLQFGFFFI